MPLATDGQVYTWDAANNTGVWKAPSGVLTDVSFGTPSVKVALTFDPGVAGTALRSDARLALDQTISPTMTGAWTFQAAATFNTAPVMAALTASRVVVTDGSKNLASAATTAAALDAAFASQSANVVWAGPPTGAAAAPSFRALVAADIPPLDASKITTGQLGVARGGTGADLSLTGGAGKYLKQSTAGGAVTVGTIPASDIVSGAALTTTDDTNVTLTLGGTPSAALLAATSLTLGWTGQLAVARGGTGASSALAAFNNLSPLTARGDLLTRDATNNVRLPLGGASTLLLSNGTDPSWGRVALLSAYHSDTTAAAVSRGDLITGQGATPAWARLALSAPAANVLNVLGVANGDVEPAWKTVLDSTNPAALTATGSAAPGTALVFAHRDHVHAVTNTSTGAASTILSTDSNSRTTLAGLLALGTTFDLVNSGATTVNFAGAATALVMGNSAGTMTVNSGVLTLAGALFNPGTGYTTDIGQVGKKFRGLYVAELLAETLIAQDTQATTGGRLLVGPTTALIADLAAAGSSVDVKHNNLSSGDRVRLEGGGLFEMMAVTSGPTTIAGGYRYNVTRNLDGTGANDWPAGSAVFNTGQAGQGFWDIFSINSTVTRPLSFVFNFNNTGSAFSATNYAAESNWTVFGDGANTEVGDAVYFGVAGAAWQNLYFSLGTAASYTATLAWEYWNGSAWTSFAPTFVGNTSGDFKATGWQGFEWSSASLTGWAANSVNSQTAFWVRVRVSAFTSWATAPVQSSRRVYSQKGQIGPTQVLWKRNSSTWSDVTEHAAFGELLGFYGYGASTIGIALGEYAAGKTHVTLDSTNGLRFFNGTTTVVGQWDTAGSVTMGPTGTGKSNLYYNASNSRLEFRGGTSVYSYFEPGGAFVLGNGLVTLDGNGITFTNAGTYVTFKDAGSAVAQLSASFLDPASSVALSSVAKTGTNKQATTEIGAQNAALDRTVIRVEANGSASSDGKGHIYIFGSAFSGSGYTLKDVSITPDGAGPSSPSQFLNVVGAGLFERKNIGTTSTDGLVLSNPQAATAGAQQYGPRLHFMGNGWKTNATAGSQQVDFIEELRPVQGAASPTGNLVWAASVNGAAYSDLMTLASAGHLGVGTSSPVFDTNSALYFAVNNAAAHAWAEVGLGGNATATTDPCGGLCFYNSSLGASDKRVAAIFGYCDGATNSGRMSFFTSNAGSITEAMRISKDGGVQIGAPTGGSKGASTLNVAGDVYKNGTAYTNPDYVLEHWATGKIEQYADKEGARDYPGLMPLAEAREFARTRLHLPRFGQEAGHGLFSGGDALLASVEEAYLYLFDHEERVSSQDGRIAELEREVADLRRRLQLAGGGKS